MKKIIIAIIGLLILASGIFFLFFNKQVAKTPAPEQMVIEKTLNISKQYVSLRYQTSNILLNAQNYPDHKTWNDEMTSIINAWVLLEAEAAILENSAQEISLLKASFSLIHKAYAYDKQEISNIFDNAPAGKKIATLAKHLGVDAKKAYKILQQDQAQVEADAWNEAGDTFQKLETSANAIKDGCKVAGFVGSIAITGGTSALAAGSTLTKAAVIISGADLTLEVSDDAAKIALGNNNNISILINDVRKVTEPISTILTISEIPNSLLKNVDKFNTAMIILDQFRGAAQEGKIIGIELPTYSQEKTTEPAKVSVLQQDELEKWLQDNNIKSNLDTKEEIEQGLEVFKEQYDAEIKKNEIKIEEAKEIEVNPEVKIVVEAKNEKPAVEEVAVFDDSGILSIVSPEGKSFTPKSGLFFAVTVNNLENLLASGRNIPVWCRWSFFLDGKPYAEKINPSTIHTGTVNVCEYSTLLVKQTGKLRVEFNLEKGTASRYSDEKNIQSIGFVKREYIVK
ncbi:MAG: hypothetical protein ACD_58C00248G0005 [uncultured bacterium]|nr:MAG: hypothetical protein ACD_58C00248G0005 [uncultured bacterium]